MPVSLSHFEIRVRDLALMEAFYTRTLGFRVTDRSPPGGPAMVFLSCSPAEHHQIVLAEAEAGSFAAGSLDHIAFRTTDLASLRAVHDALRAHGGLAPEPVSHGTTWSVYFQDPEGNRLEFFVDTPWHVAQPLRFPIDLSKTDSELAAWTKAKIASLDAFQPAERWFREHRRRLQQGDA